MHQNNILRNTLDTAGFSPVFFIAHEKPFILPLKERVIPHLTFQTIISLVDTIVST